MQMGQSLEKGNNRMDFLCEVAMSDSIGGDGDGETETSEVGGEGIDGEEMEGEGEERRP